MKDIIKILLFVKNIDGGTGTFLFDFLKIKKIFKNQLEIKTVVFEKPKFNKTNSFTFIHKKAFYPTKYSFLDAFKYLLNDISYVKKIIEKEKPNLVLSINNYANIIVTLSSFFLTTKPKIILTHRNNLSQLIKNRCSFILREMLKITLPILYKKAKVHIAVSKGVARDINKISRQTDIKVVYNGVALKKTIKIKHLGNNRKIVSIGRFDEQKDFFTLITAFAELKKELINVSLNLIGGGVDLKKINDHIYKLGLRKLIRIIKWKNNVRRYLDKSDLFILSSNYEGFSYVILEAMSSGLPIISTNTPYGPSEILDNGRYGVLVPMKDPQAMAKAMYELLTDEKKYNYYSKKSLARVKYFSLEKMLRAYKKIILDLANK